MLDRLKQVRSGARFLLPRGPAVFAFGDSHTRCASDTGGFCSAYVGPVTLNRLGRPGEASRLLREAVRPAWSPLRRMRRILGISSLKKGDAVLVIAGEIDVRCHVEVQTRERGRTLKEVLEDLGDSAARSTEELRAAFPIRVFFCSIIPPTAGEENPEWPFRGTLAERSEWTARLNEILRSKLAGVGVSILDPYSSFRGEDGTLLAKFRDESVHLANAFGPIAFGPLEQRIRRDG